MSLTVRTPRTDELDEVVEAMATWQPDGVPLQLHPGDLGWQWRLGADVLAGTVRVWRRDDEVVAVGFGDLDEPAVLRLAVAPSIDIDEAAARELVRDLEDPATGVFTTGEATVEARLGAALRAELDARGWSPDESWTSLHRDLTDPVEAGALRVETVGPDYVPARVAVQLSAFSSSTFTAEKWHTMADTRAYRRARCLVGFDDADVAVAAVTVWSAGSGRPGILEPMGVHRDHRGQGHGTAITVAAAAALREMGASGAMVATPSANIGGVATYVAAGFDVTADVTDFRRPL